MAATTNLITSFVRRISKYFNSTNFTWGRPKRVTPGANHIDNPTDFDARTIYRGEEIIDFTKGNLYTQDGGEIIELNKPNGIVSGLRVVEPSVVGAFGGGSLWVSVESGVGRIYGKNYYHEPVSGTASGDIQIQPNPNLTKARIDIIALKSGYPNPAPVGVVGSFGVDSTEYAAGLTAIGGSLYNQGRALTFVGDYSGSGTTITINSSLSASAISVGDNIIGVNITGAVTVTNITTSGGFIVSIDISVAPIAASTNSTYALPIYTSNVCAIKGDISAGNNVITNVYPQPLLNDIIIGQGIPEGTIATNVATIGSVTLSNSATLTKTESIFQIGDVVDHILYDATSPWPVLPEDHILLGLVYVPSNYTALSSPNILRPWSVNDLWTASESENQTPRSLVSKYISQIQEYVSDATYMSGSTIIDPQVQSINRVVKNHYSSDLDTSLNSGAIVKISSGGVGGGGSQTLEQVLLQGNSTGGNQIASPDANTTVEIYDGSLGLTCTDNINTQNYISIQPAQIEHISTDLSNNDNTYIFQNSSNIQFTNTSATGTQVNQVSISQGNVGLKNDLNGTQIQEMYVDGSSFNAAYNDGINTIYLNGGLTNGVMLGWADTTTFDTFIRTKFNSIELSVDDTVINFVFKVDDNGYYLKNLPAFDDDAAAGIALLPQGFVYQTTGSGAAPLNVAGILMIKQ